MTEELHSEVSSRGGVSSKKIAGAQKRSEDAKRAADARWGNLPRAIYSSAENHKRAWRALKALEAVGVQIGPTDSIEAATAAVCQWAKGDASVRRERERLRLQQKRSDPAYLAEERLRNAARMRRVRAMQRSTQDGQQMQQADKTINGTGKRGRPRVDATPVHVQIPPSELAALDGWIASQPEPQPSRPQALRLLAGLATGNTAATDAFERAFAQAFVPEMAAWSRTPRWLTRDNFPWWVRWMLLKPTKR